MGPPPLDVRVERVDFGEATLNARSQHRHATKRDLLAGWVRVLGGHLPFVVGVEEQQVGILLGAGTRKRIALAEARLGRIVLREPEIRFTEVAPALRLEASV